MKLITTFWNDNKFEFDQLLFINRDTHKVKYQTDLKNHHQTGEFFSDISKFINTSAVYILKKADVCFQFAVIKDGEITPIIWFDLVINNKLTISHDSAFSTTIIHKNVVVVPFGKFFKEYPPKHREFNIKYRAYKYISNQIKKSQKVENIEDKRIKMNNKTVIVFDNLHQRTKIIGKYDHVSAVYRPSASTTHGILHEVKDINEIGELASNAGKRVKKMMSAQDYGADQK